MVPLRYVSGFFKGCHKGSIGFRVLGLEVWGSVGQTSVSVISRILCLFGEFE